MKGYSQGNMSPEVKDYQAPKGSYCQKYDQAPLNYVERQNKMVGKEAAKLRSQEYKGRYN